MRSPVVAVLGATGFVGSAVCVELRDAGFEVRPVKTPRLRVEADASALPALSAAVPARVVVELISEFHGVDYVVNAAGVAQATGKDESVLLGANALLPLVALRASSEVGARLVHISSAAVQGAVACLDETTRHAPFSPYSLSKSLGERALEAEANGALRILRPTSVHGSDRSITRLLAKFARSPLSSVVSPGDRHTPQVHVRNVAHAVRLCLVDQSLPEIVLQPSEGWTTSSFLEALGAGRLPRELPPSVGRGALSVTGRLPDGFAGWHRRLEMLWMGQSQSGSALDGRSDWPAGLDDWRLMAGELAR